MTNVSTPIGGPGALARRRRDPDLRARAALFWLARRALGASIGLAAMAPGVAAAAQPLRVQLSWTHQAQYAGYYVAEARGFYQREGIVVSLVEGGPGIAPLERLARGEVDVAVAWLAHALDTRLRGADLVNVAQVFQRPGLALACRKSAGVRGARDLAGRSIGVWNLGDEASARLWLRRAGLDDGAVALVPQAARAADLIAGRVPCATVMLYNELWDALEAGLRTADLVVVRFSEEGLGTLEDGLYVRRASLEDVQFCRRLAAFLRAAAAGWGEARLSPEEATAITLTRSPGLDRAHQERMLESVLTLVPAAGPFGLLPPADYERTVEVLAAGASNPDGLRRAARGGWTHRIWYAAGLAPAAPLPVATQHYLAAAVSSPWFHALDLIGTAAFGLAGFMRARQRRYDLWGAFVLTLLPAVGGGTLRDLLVGGDRHPPFIFKDSTYLAIVLGVVVAGMLVSRFAPASVSETRGFNWSLTVLDTVGLSTFTVVGAEVALGAGLGWYWVAICSALTSAGGGMLLDVVTGREPRTFLGEPYEEIAVGGGLLLYLLLRAGAAYEHSPWMVTATIVSTLAAVFAARMLVVALGLRSYRLEGRPTPRARLAAGLSRVLRRRPPPPAA